MALEKPEGAAVERSGSTGLVGSASHVMYSSLRRSAAKGEGGGGERVGECEGECSGEHRGEFRGEFRGELRGDGDGDCDSGDDGGEHAKRLWREARKERGDIIVTKPKPTFPARDKQANSTCAAGGERRREEQKATGQRPGRVN